jgi:hypothetical protein
MCRGSKGTCTVAMAAPQKKGGCAGRGTWVRGYLASEQEMLQPNWVWWLFWLIRTTTPPRQMSRQKSEKGFFSSSQQPRIDKSCDIGHEHRRRHHRSPVGTSTVSAPQHGLIPCVFVAWPPISAPAAVTLWLRSFHSLPTHTHTLTHAKRGSSSLFIPRPRPFVHLWPGRAQPQYTHALFLLLLPMRTTGCR